MMPSTQRMDDTMDVPKTLRIQGYSISYGEGERALKVLDDINLDIGHGEVVGLVGESGSGKSTLAFAIMRALRGRTSGEAGQMLLGTDSLRDLDEQGLNKIRGKRIAMVFQDPGGSLNPTLSLGEHFRQTLTRHSGLTPDKVIKETHRLLSMVGLPDASTMALKFPYEVSGGEKQRAVIALAFACDPELILFDEPTSALDATTAANILDLFRELQKQTGVSALFISHDLGVVREIAHRVAVIYAGRILEIGPVQKLYAAPRHPYTRSLLASLPKPSVGEDNQPLVSIPGSLPDRTLPIIGCNFADRCQFATKKCWQEPIDLVTATEHAVACPYWESVLKIKINSGDETATIKCANTERVARLSMENLSVEISRPDLFAWLMGRKPKTIHAVNNVDLVLHGGETLGLVGESGCGKSSLAKALVGLRKFKGRVLLGDTPVYSLSDMGKPYRKQVQIIFQNPDLSLNPRQSIATILSRPLKLYQKDISDNISNRISKLLERVNLPADFASRYPHELSGGEKQRVAIARALATEPEVIICDEITSGLDASIQASIVNLLRKVQVETGISYLFITHDLNLLRHIADRVAVMYLGEIVEVRPANKIGVPPYQPYTEALLSSAPVLDSNLELRRIRLEGSLPSRIGRVTGCSFASRCHHRIGTICDTKKPCRTDIQPGHWIRCHLDTDSLLAVPPIWSTQKLSSPDN